jgi:heterodisulfide reductase subunit A
MKESVDCIIVGAGPAGLTAGKELAKRGFQVIILEKEPVPGGKLQLWNSLFPHHEKASDVLNLLLDGVESIVHTGITIDRIVTSDNGYMVTDTNGNYYSTLALVVTTGFQPFDARIKEEYGYGIYRNVITSMDLEKMFKANNIRTAEGKVPDKVAIIHCVGSRDIKVSREHCSAVCCITGIKQAMEFNKRIPGIRVSNLYMDLRLHGRLYEELYKQAQMNYQVQFIRGRLSETNQNADGSLVIRYEDTLAGKPAKMTVDMVVLLVGMEPSPLASEEILLEKGSDGFLGQGKIADVAAGKSNGLFYAGACTGPKNLTESMNEASRIALEAAHFLSGISVIRKEENHAGIRI